MNTNGKQATGDDAGPAGRPVAAGLTGPALWEPWLRGPAAGTPGRVRLHTLPTPWPSAAMPHKAPISHLPECRFETGVHTGAQIGFKFRHSQHTCGLQACI
jgi:hypothetical protein